MSTDPLEQIAKDLATLRQLIPKATAINEEVALLHMTLCAKLDFIDDPDIARAARGLECANDVLDKTLAAMKAAAERREKNPREATDYARTPIP